MNSKNPIAQAWADHSRSWQENLYVYPVLSRRAGGISIGVNLNLDKACTFDCPYCQVDRSVPGPRRAVSVEGIAQELEAMIAAYRRDGLASFPSFAGVPAEARVLRDLCLSGDGESTLCPEFPAVCRLLSDVQVAHAELDLKLVLITNATLLHLPRVQQGLETLCARRGEIWGKLDAGTEAWFQRVNVSRHTLDHVQSNLEATAARFPMRIQTMLCTLEGEAPSAQELQAYVQRVARVHALAPGNLLGVQLYSVVRSTARPHIGPVPLDYLQETARLLQQYCPGLAVGIYP